MTENVTNTTEPCPACGEPVPEAGSCCGFSGNAELEAIPPFAELVMEKTGTKIPIKTRWMRIGRDQGNQVVLTQDLYASRHHAWITYEKDVFWLEDLGSTNGTLLNGQPLDRREVLASGDKIKIGETELQFVLLEKNG